MPSLPTVQFLIRGAILALLFVIAVGLLFGPAGSHAAGSPLDRLHDPVVLTGADVASLAGVDPDDVVAFKYDGGWQQVPVQVDERDVKDFCDVYGIAGGSGLAGQAFTVPCGESTLMYTDTGTFTGADSDTALDADDEIVFMAKDAGDIAGTTAEPAGVIPGSGVWLTITDPLMPAKTGHVYLFESDGSLTPGAGQQYVSYTFNLLSGPYLTTYNTLDGPNPEDSSATTAFYAHHFSDRWTTDELQITAGASTGVDILDRHKALFSPGFCGRHEDTFANGEGAFIVNKSGPVRALRGYVGANSGPLTQRVHVLYERRQDIRTFLRVHTIPSVMDFFDYSPEASGMTYYNDLNLSGVTIDGSPETPAAGAILWEMVEGAQGSLVMRSSVSTNITGFSFTSYYLDDSTPPVTQCTGDAFAYGSSGTWINQSIPNTDPAQGASDFLHVTRTMYYDSPGLTVAEAQALADQGSTPLQVIGAGFPPGDMDGDGCADAKENGPDETLGGLRDPLNPWDFYDVNGDQIIDLSNDIFEVIQHYAPTGTEPEYDVAFDRGPQDGPNVWNMTAPDGVIDLTNDILGVILQYFHSCQ